MRQRVEEALEPIVKLLNEQNEDSEDLWAILTALRGPDNGDISIKEQTTARIRYKIGLKQNFWRLYFVSSESLGEPDHIFNIAKQSGIHFAEHAYAATQALDNHEGKIKLKLTIPPGTRLRYVNNVDIP